jgi:hypothetical protein
MIHQAQLMKISWAFLMAQGCGWLGAYEHWNIYEKFNSYNYISYHLFLCGRYLATVRFVF